MDLRILAIYALLGISVVNCGQFLRYETDRDYRNVVPNSNAAGADINKQPVIGIVA
jgi:hypothetical protein